MEAMQHEGGDDLRRVRVDMGTLDRVRSTHTEEAAGQLTVGVDDDGGAPAWSDGD